MDAAARVGDSDVVAGRGGLLRGGRGREGGGSDVVAGREGLIRGGGGRDALESRSFPVGPAMVRRWRESVMLPSRQIAVRRGLDRLQLLPNPRQAHQ
jgi:hypothetical protein